MVWALWSLARLTMTRSRTLVGSRLCFKSEELVEYFNKQFAYLLQITLAE